VSARRIAPEWVAIEAREIFFCSKVRASAMQGLTPSKKEQQVITEAHGKIDIMHHHYYNPLIFLPITYQLAHQVNLIVQIQVVCRLIQKGHPRLLYYQGGEIYTSSFTARERGERPVLHPLEPHTGELLLSHFNIDFTFTPKWG